MRLKVIGHSMEPTLQQGDKVWALHFARKFRKGDVVVLRMPSVNNTLAIKRVANLLGNARYEVRGDNPNDSLDSSSFGAVSEENIVGKVYLRYWPLKETRWFA